MKPLEELALVVGILAGVYTLSRGLGSSSGNACSVPASNPSGTVQTTPLAGQAPSIPIPALTNPFTTQAAQP